MVAKSLNRAKRIIGECIDRYKLDLKDLVVLTEAASGNFVFTPIIAALAGSPKVYALTKDSEYAPAREVEKATYSFASTCGVGNNIEVIFEKEAEVVSAADIITNLGFVRPIDKKTVRKMKDTSVVSLMYEPWEFRQEDIDLEECKKRGIPVMGTNEEATEPSIFLFCGVLVLKVLLSVEIEVCDSKIVILSRDKFGRAINAAVKALGGDAHLVGELRGPVSRHLLEKADALVIADYHNSETVIGREGQITAEELKKISSDIIIIQLYGGTEAEELEKQGILLVPSGVLKPRKMGMTVGDLGPRPVIELHTAGLKVGELMARARLNGLNVNETEEMVSCSGLGCSLNV